MSNEAAERLLDLMTPEMREWAERHVIAALAAERNKFTRRGRCNGVVSRENKMRPRSCRNPPFRP